MIPKTNLNLNGLTKEALAELPIQLLTEFQQAIINLDLQLIQTFIEQISKMNQQLAYAISDCIKRFNYEQLLDLIASLNKEI